MGSTSYDEPRDPSDATWSGASWYGPSSGEYWIVNPREYADPRKHGPEYQQRARRPLTDDAPEEAPGAFTATGTTTGSTRAGATEPARPTRGAWRASSGTTEAAAPRASGWTTPGPVPKGTAGMARPGDPAPGDAAPDVLRVESVVAASRAWLGGPADDPIRRLGLALLAWPPIGLAAAAVIGEVTGCSGFSAACTDPQPLLPWVAQAAILGLLLLLPAVTRLLAGGAVAVLLALLPISAFLIAIGGSGAPQVGPTMAVLLAGAWLAGVAWSARTFRRDGAAGVAT